MDEYGRNITENTLALLERAVLCALSGRLPEVNTVIVKYTHPDEFGGYMCSEVEVSSLQELIEILMQFTKSEEKISNIKLSGRVAN